MNAPLKDLARREAILALGYERDPSVFPLLVDLLGDPAAPIRHAVILALGRHGDPAAVPVLATPRVFRSAATDVRWAAVAVIGELGDVHALELLARAAEDEEWVVRDQAVNAFRTKAAAVAERRDPAAVPVLVRLLECDRDEIVALTVEALAAMAETAAAPLLRALNAKSARLRANAAVALGAMRRSDSAAALVPLLADPDPRVRRNAARSLGRIRNAPDGTAEALIDCLGDNAAEVRAQAMEALVEFGPAAAAPLRLALRHAQNKFVQKAMVLTLGALGDPDSIPELVRHLRSTYFIVRAAAVKALVPFGRSAVPHLVPALSCNRADVRPLVRGVLQTEDGACRFRALRALGALEDPRAVEALKKTARSDDAELAEAAEASLFRIGTAAWGRCAALVCLREIADPQSLAAVTSALDDPSENVRLEAVRALAKFPAGDLVTHLVRFLRSEKDPFLRSEALGVLRQTGSSDPRLCRLGLSALRESDWNVRHQAAGLLGNLRNRAAVPALIRALSDPRWGVQESAENALHNFGSDALPALVSALGRSPSAAARQRAARLIGEVAGRRALPALGRAARRKGEAQSVLRAVSEAEEKIRQRHPAR